MKIKIWKVELKNMIMKIYWNFGIFPHKRRVTSTSSNCFPQGNQLNLSSGQAKNTAVRPVERNKKAAFAFHEKHRRNHSFPKSNTRSSQKSNPVPACVVNTQISAFPSKRKNKQAVKYPFSSKTSRKWSMF